MKKITAKQLVAQHLEILKNMSHGDLFRFSRDHGFDSRSGFAAFKKALLAEGIDYAALRAGKRAERQAALEAEAAHSLTLYVDAKARTDRFAVCDAEGDPIWHGKFFDDHRDYHGEQSSGELAAAKKAVWLAGKVAEALGTTAIRLTLMVDAKWLTWANECLRPEWNGKTGGKAKALAEVARRHNVLLTVEHVAGEQNPADEWTVTRGFRRWNETDLAMLTDQRIDARRERKAEARREAERKLEPQSQPTPNVEKETKSERQTAHEQQVVKDAEQKRQKLAAVRSALGDDHELILRCDRLEAKVAGLSGKAKKTAKYELRHAQQAAFEAAGMESVAAN